MQIPTFTRLISQIKIDLQIPTNTPRHRVQHKTNRYGWVTQTEGSRTGRDLTDKLQDLPEQQQKEFNSSK